MEEKKLKKRLLIKKVIACLLLAVAVTAFFVNWVTFDSREFSDAIEELEDEFKDARRGMFREYDDILEEIDDDLDIDNMVDGLGSIIDVIGKEAYSPMDVVPVSVGIFKIASYTNNEEATELIFGNSDYREMQVTFAVIKVVVVVVLLLCLLPVLLGLLHLILHLFNRRALGISVTILSFFWAFLTTALVFVLYVAEPDLEIGLTVWPWMAFLCSLISCIVWGTAKGDIRKLERMKQSAETAAEAPAAEEVKEN